MRKELASRLALPLRPNVHDRGLVVSSSLVLYIVRTQEIEEQRRHPEPKRVVDLAALLPGMDFSRRSFRVVVVVAVVQPVRVGVRMEVLEVAELVHWVVLQVVHLDHVVLIWLWLGFRDVAPSVARAVPRGLSLVQALVDPGGGDRSCRG